VDPEPDSDPQHWPGERGCGARGQVLQQAHVPGVHLALTRLVVKTGPDSEAFYRMNVINMRLVVKTDPESARHFIA
jgi:hypothetical protein